MRKDRRIPAVFLAMVLMGSSGCRRAVPAPSSTLHVANSATANQLLWGLYDVEQSSSRWSAGDFCVALAPPAGSERTGATVWVRLFIPDRHIEALGPMTLSGEVDGRPLEAHTFVDGGMHIYASEIPREVLDTNVLPIHFSFDRAAPPSLQDPRELGAVITDVGLKIK